MEKEEEKIKKLKMHETINLERSYITTSYTTTRVPGGLLYNRYSFGGMFSASKNEQTFVPFKEFID